MSGTDREWIYAVGDQRKGPMSASEIALLVSGDQLPDSTLVWKAGMSEWVPAKGVPEIAALCAPGLPRRVAASHKPPAPWTASPIKAAAGGKETVPSTTLRADSEERRWWGGWLSSPVLRWSASCFLMLTGLALRGLGEPTWLFTGWVVNGVAAAVVVGVLRKTRWWMVPAGIIGGCLGFGIMAGVFALLNRALPSGSGGSASSVPSQPAPTSIVSDQPAPAALPEPQRLLAGSQADDPIAQLRSAADRGDSGAQYELGARYRRGDGVARDVVEAEQWLRRAADQGHSEAQYNLGHLYDVGDGVPKDFGTAAEWFRSAAVQGHAEAQYALGIAYHHGEGVSRDIAQAQLWWRKAADQGHAEAQFNLALLFAEGRLVPRDHVEAVRWQKKAAERGHPVAQYLLGRAYFAGVGVPRDHEQAVLWLGKAAEQGSNHQIAADAAAELRRIKQVR